MVTLLREVLDHQADFVYATVGDDTKEKWMELGDSWASGDETKTPGGVVSQDPSQHTHAPLYKCLTISLKITTTRSPLSPHSDTHERF